jgi:hypothetical protein
MNIILEKLSYLLIDSELITKFCFLLNILIEYDWNYIRQIFLQLNYHCFRYIYKQQYNHHHHQQQQEKEMNMMDIWEQQTITWQQYIINATNTTTTTTTTTNTITNTFATWKDTINYQEKIQQDHQQHQQHWKQMQFSSNTKDVDDEQENYSNMMTIDLPALTYLVYHLISSHNEKMTYTISVYHPHYLHHLYHLCFDILTVYILQCNITITQSPSDHQGIMLHYLSECVFQLMILMSRKDQYTCFYIYMFLLILPYTNDTYSFSI